jgi:hypothetical protein
VGRWDVGGRAARSVRGGVRRRRRGGDRRRWKSRG